MLTKRIIACLDVDAGRVVKGTRFLNLRDAGDPAELATTHALSGADEIVLLDITATHESRSILIDTVRRTARELFIPFTVGGGIRTLQDAEAIFNAAPIRSVSTQLQYGIRRSSNASRRGLARKQFWLRLTRRSALSSMSTRCWSQVAANPPAGLQCNGRGRLKVVGPARSSSLRWIVTARAAA